MRSPERRRAAGHVDAAETFAAQVVGDRADVIAQARSHAVEVGRDDDGARRAGVVAVSIDLAQADVAGSLQGDVAVLR